MAKKKGKGSLDVASLIANENLINTDVTDEIEEAMLTYAIKTITDRAIPEVRDGLKPVHRRILYGSFVSGFTPNKKFVKNAKIVGEVMGNYHPHGDSSIYDALVNMSQPWTYRYPLIDFQGNNGSYDGDTAAAMRYTEGRLDKKALILLRDVENECVTFRPNYSETTEEPEVLPGLFPNLLLNGASGIATGYTTDIPSHQLGEVVDGIIYTIKNPDCKIVDIMKYIKAPDFSTGAYLLNNEKIRELYETGRGSLTFKAKYKIEQNEESGNNQIVFTELPPDINKPKLVEQIHNICLEEKKISRVIDVRDESEGNEIRIVIELHKTAVLDVVVSELYDKTPLQKNKNYIVRAIVGQTPKILTLKEIITHYIEHRRDVIFRRTSYLLDKTKQKLHIQEGLKIVTDDIDKAIEIIKNSNSDVDAKNGLIKHFSITEEQVKEVLEIRLRQLTKLNKKDIEDLIDKLKAEIAKCELIISHVDELDKVIISELQEIKREFNDERKTELVDETQLQKIEITGTNEEPMVVLLTNKNTIKHITVKAFQDMIKGGSLKERNELFIQAVNCTINDSFILILDSGEYVKVEFNDLMSGLTFIENKAVVKGIVAFNENDDKAVVIMTKKGLVKKVKIDGFKARLRRVAPLLELVDDEIISLKVIEQNDDNIITIATKDGLIHRFFEKSFKDTAAGGKGISGINISDDNEVIDFDISNQNDDDKGRIVVFTKHDDGSFGIKSMSLSEFKPKGRVSQGIRGVEFNKKNNGVVKGLLVTNKDFIALDAKGNVLNYKLISLPILNRYSKPDVIKDDVLITRLFLD